MLSSAPGGRVSATRPLKETPPPAEYETTTDFGGKMGSSRLATNSGRVSGLAFSRGTEWPGRIESLSVLPARYLGTGTVIVRVCGGPAKGISVSRMLTG